MQFDPSQNKSNRYDQSPIPTWLNGTFYNSAFTSTQKNYIPSTTVTLKLYNSDQTSTTQNYVFLLGHNEANTTLNIEEYLKNDNARKKIGTDYAKANNLSVSSSQMLSGQYTSYWWLSSESDNDWGDGNFAYTVKDTGEFVGVNVDASRGEGICPALWFTLP